MGMGGDPGGVRGPAIVDGILLREPLDSRVGRTATLSLREFACHRADEAPDAESTPSGCCSRPE